MSRPPWYRYLHPTHRIAAMQSADLTNWISFLFALEGHKALIHRDKEKEKG